MYIHTYAHTLYTYIHIYIEEAAAGEAAVAAEEEALELK
jgi:hypothetical protein